jgi:4-hydroxymandelate oxidase
MDLINLFDYESAARDELPQMAFDYYASGSDDEVTLRDNRDAYGGIALRYSVLRDIAERNLSTSILGQDISIPILVAPTAFHRLACDEGELATAKAADRMGTILILSTLSTTAMEQVAEVAGEPVWFQLYFYRDREATAELAQLWGVRERDVRNRFQLPEGLSMPNLAGGMSRVAAAEADSGLAAYVAEMGAAGVIVSNHGGRQLDTSVATIRALPGGAEAVRETLVRENRDRSEFVLLLDGGVRRGTDVVKALAMGTDAVCVGRPVLWGLAVDGEDGVVRVLELLRDESDTAMGLCGATSSSELKEMASDLIVWPDRG